MGTNLMFPPCYYFSLKCCSAACLTILTRALQGQKVWSTPRAPDHKQVRIPSILLLFVSADVRTRHPRHLCRALERWRLTDELRESSYVAQPSVSETRLCQSLPVCSSGKTCQRRLAWCCKQEWPRGQCHLVPCHEHAFIAAFSPNCLRWFIHT